MCRKGLSRRSIACLARHDLHNILPAKLFKVVVLNPAAHIGEAIAAQHIASLAIVNPGSNAQTAVT